ncbi:hypothetical protein HPP92_001288 [Vanilla planifolia]|uniref:Secreted protein n=1 Tax=Vanilla planifolia TaxID=51239 RepID=A0A835RZM0_VANPL|nr:hypothetical protein HPP92_001288 [Vanilla planifolia]
MPFHKYSSLSVLLCLFISNPCYKIQSIQQKVSFCIILSFFFDKCNRLCKKINKLDKSVEPLTWKFFLLICLHFSPRDSSILIILHFNSYVSLVPLNIAKMPRKPSSL